MQKPTTNRPTDGTSWHVQLAEKMTHIMQVGYEPYLCRILFDGPLQAIRTEGEYSFQCISLRKLHIKGRRMHTGCHLKRSRPRSMSETGD